jgi:hypothetical protein
MKVIKNEVISGTEPNPTKEETNFNEKWQKHKENYLKEKTVEEMVYENGTAIAFLYKEVQRLSSNITTLINQNNGNEEK